MLRVIFRFLAFVFRIALAVSIGAGCGAVLAVYVHYSSQAPELKAALNYHPHLISRMYDRNGNLLAEFARERRIMAHISEIPEIMQHAIVAIEDEHFYNHRGLDILGIMRAAWVDFLAGKVVQGGSTITQQLSKSLFLSSERTFKRKIQEAFLALELEKVLTKNRILELYLNQVYFGSGCYGIEAASRRYFGKSCSRLTLPEAALLAGLPKAPSKFSPINNPDLALKRRNTVIRRMLSNHYITRAQAETALNTPIELHIQPWMKSKAPYFVEVLRRKLEKEYGTEYLYTEGLKINTTLNLEFQVAAEKAVRWGLHEVEKKRRKWRGPVPGLKLATTPPEVGEPAGAEITSVKKDRLSLTCGGLPATLKFKDIWVKNKDLLRLKPGDRVWVIVDEYGSKDGEKTITACRITQEPQVEGALLSIDPHTGEVLAWVGGYDFKRSQFDRVSQSPRQPGSAFKPFIYAAALNGSFTASDVIYDTPIVIEKTWGVTPKKETETPDGEEDEKEYWKPHNYSEEFFGATTLREGLAKSRNIISIHLLQKLGVPAVIRMARRLGIRSPLTPTLSLALGASELTLKELTHAYCAFATLGISAEPMMVRNILDRDDRIVREYYPAIHRAMREDSAYLITNLLKGVVENGTGVRARALKRPVAGKTGTTNNYHDAWFMGFSPDIVTGTWVGMDLPEPICRRATGASVALPIWMKFMEKALRSYPPRDFPVPPGIIFVDVCKETGQLATPACEKIIHEAFREGTEPMVYCRKHGTSRKKISLDISTDWDE